MASDQITLDAAVREETGKSVAGRLRREGRVPATIYGLDRPTRSLHVDSVALYHALHTPAGMNVLIRLKAGDVEQLAMPQEVQRHPVRGDYLHIDFIRIDVDTDVNVEVPVLTIGDESVKPGVVTVALTAVPVICKPLLVPDSITIDVTGLTIGDTIHAEAVALPEGVTLDIDPERTVVTISAPSLELEETEEEEVEEGVEAAAAAEEGEAEGEAESADEGGDE